MKFASYKDGRDGKFLLVSKDLTQACFVPDIASTFQQALDNWPSVKSKLQTRYDALNANQVKDAFAFNPTKTASPLPRAYQFADGSAYVNHVELVRKARGAEMPENFWHDPLIYQGGSDSFLGPNDPIQVESEEWGIDFESEVAIITDDVPMGINPEEAEHHIIALMLVNDVSLRNLIPAELAKSFGFFQSKPASSFSPIAVTPDELGSAWDGKRVHLPLKTYLNNTLFGEPNAGIDMVFSFPQLIAHAAKSRYLSTGTIIGSGTVSNVDRSKGSSCIAEKRMLEIIEDGKPTTPFMKFGDQVRIEMHDVQGKSIFGAIDQFVVQYEKDANALPMDKLVVRPARSL
ncbi:MAG: fumarylacetoacetate hydrolase family protein [Alphaproteobacteria bacterium]|nr:fumarylacetoacetate hydrolase family protein [Alphaproteobacteria bacterium]